jgi:MFS family permease
MFVIVSWVLVGIAAGSMLGGALGDFSANHPGDIGRIFGGLLVGAMMGTTLGGLIGKSLKNRFADDPRKLKLAGASTWLFAGLVVLGIVALETARENKAQRTRLNDSMLIRYEIRLPPGMAANPEHVILELRTNTGNLPPYPYQQRPPVVQEDDRAVIRNAFQIFRTATERTVALQLAHGQPTFLFKLRLPDRPEPGGAMTGWQPVDQVDEGGWFKSPRPVRADERLEIRYAVARPFG